MSKEQQSQQSKSEYMRTLHDQYGSQPGETKKQQLQRLQDSEQGHSKVSYSQIPDSSQIRSKEKDKLKPTGQSSYDKQYDKMRKFTGTQTWSHVSMAGSMARSIPGLQGSMAGALLQSGTRGVSSSQNLAKSRARRQYEKELGAVGRADQLGRSINSLGRMSYSANLIKSLGSTAMGGGASPTGSALYSAVGLLGMPASLALALPSLIGGIGASKKMKKIMAVKKQPDEIAREYSQAGNLDTFYKKLRSEEGGITPFQQLQYLLLAYIESHTSPIPAIYSLLDEKEQHKTKGSKVFKSSYGARTGMKEFDDDKDPKSESIFNKIEDSINKVISRYDPIVQLSNFIFGGKKPQDVLDDINKGKGPSGADRKKELESIKNVGAGKDQFRLMSINSMSLVSSARSYEEKMLALSSGQYDLVRFIAQEAITIRRHGFGVRTNKFAQPIEKGGALGRAIAGIDHMLSNIPGLSALYNIGKDLINLPKKGTEFIKGTFDKSMNVIFGKDFRRLQDRKEVDKELGYDKSLQEKAEEFAAVGLPTLLEKMRSLLAQQLETQHNLFNASKHQYELLYGYYTGKRTQFDYAKTLSDDVTQERIWDDKEGKMLTQQGFELAQEKRDRQRQYLREKAFNKSLLSFLSTDLLGQENIEDRMARVLTPVNKMSKSIDRLLKRPEFEHNIKTGMFTVSDEDREIEKLQEVREMFIGDKGVKKFSKEASYALDKKGGDFGSSIASLAAGTSAIALGPIGLVGAGLTSFLRMYNEQQEENKITETEYNEYYQSEFTNSSIVE